jgi:branched-chain amino acid transport system permease protein
MLQLVVNGLAMGCIYALVALGFLLIYQAVGALNFAQGELVMLGGFLGISLALGLKLPLPLAFLLTILLMAAIGWLFQRVAYYPLRNRPFAAVIISTVGVGIALRNGAQLIWGPNPLSFPGLFGAEPIRVAGTTILPQHLFIIAVTLLLLAAQYWFFTRTALGRQLQATAQDAEMARLMGIPVGRMIAATFMLSAAMAGVAGLLLAPVFFVTTDMGGMVMLKAFVASIIGGFGSIPGAIVGALFVGVMETFVAAYVSSAYKDAFAFLILILVLFVAPRGLFGEKISEKV